MHFIKKEVPKLDLPTGINWILIYDRSGSMSWIIKHLVEDVKSQLRKMKPGDTVTVGWFSTESGKYDYPVKAHLLTEESFATLDSMLDTTKYTIGLTCFSEVLEELPKIMDTLEHFNPNNALQFFTDGHPVVSNRRREETKVLEALDAIKGRLAFSQFIGYGDYYNKKFMEQMADAAGGTLVHASNVQEYSAAADGYLTTASPSVSFVTSNPIIALMDNGVIYQDLEQKHLPNKITKYYEIVGGGTPKEHNLVYAYAYALMQRKQVDAAIHALSKIGDAVLIDKCFNCYTNADYADAEQALLDAIKYPSRRNASPENIGYVPDGNQYNIVELLADLADDSKAMFYPYHEDFKYRPIGIKKLPVAGSLKFTPDVKEVPLNNLVFNIEKANISIQAVQYGTVQLDNDMGLPETFPTHRTKNYTIVKDGVLNMSRLPVSTTREMFRKLKKHGLVNGEWVNGNVYTIHLETLPMINRALVEKSVKLPISSIQVDLELSVKLKVIKYLIGLLNPDKISDSWEYTQEQQIFLMDNGIQPYGFSPKMESAGVTDYYEATVIDIYKKGISSIPSVTKGLQGNPAKEVTQLFTKYMLEFETTSLAELEDALKATKAEQKVARTPIQLFVFACVVTGYWPWHDDKVEFNGFVFNRKTEKVEL